MRKFRESIKDKYIWDLDINPVEYDRERGVDRKNVKSQEYKYDDADKLIFSIARQCLVNKWQLRNTFSLLYDCISLQKAQFLLGKPKKLKTNENSNPGSDDDIIPLPVATIQKYIKRIKKAIGEEFENSDKLEEEIKNRIESEYNGSTN